LYIQATTNHFFRDVRTIILKNIWNLFLCKNKVLPLNYPDDKRYFRLYSQYSEATDKTKETVFKKLLL
jgi:hypothetical protein